MATTATMAAASAPGELPAPRPSVSVLSATPGGGARSGSSEAPDSFHDLGLDQIVDALTAGREDYDLKPFFYTPLRDLDAIAYRHEVMRDLEGGELLAAVRAFAERMRAMRQSLTASEKLPYNHQRKRWFLGAVELHDDAVEGLLLELRRVPPRSRGLLAFRGYLEGYVETGSFKERRRETAALKAELTAVRYTLLIKDAGVTVRRYAGEADYGAVVEGLFEKFKQGAVKDYRVELADSPGMNHVEARILELVARLNPGVFQSLDAFCGKHRGYADETIAVFDREIQFYVACLDYRDAFRRAGLPFCYPEFSRADKAEAVRGSFDLALAGRLVRDDTPVVRNDFFLAGKERIFVVTGPNQGGKTTFARVFGQLHYLASLGCPVPAEEARLVLCDRIFTHFEREESLQTLRGKLQDDLVRIHRILDQATPDSVIILNEIFSSTTTRDATFLARKVMERVTRLGALCVCVTFLDELATLNEKTVSVVALVAPDDPARRTHKLGRRPADGLACALAIAEKYRLTYGRLKERLKR